MDLNINTLMLSMLFGAIGLGMFMYGKKAGQMIPLGVGLALMIFPYFIPDAMILTIVGIALTAVPFVVRGS